MIYHVWFPSRFRQKKIYILGLPLTRTTPTKTEIQDDFQVMDDKIFPKRSSFTAPPTSHQKNPNGGGGQNKRKNPQPKILNHFESASKNEVWNSPIEFLFGSWSPAKFIRQRKEDLVMTVGTTIPVCNIKSIVSIVSVHFSIYRQLSSFSRNFSMLFLK